MKILTYNIRVEMPRDTGNKFWIRRKKDVSTIIKNSKADIIMLQEVGNIHQRLSLQCLLPNFSYFGKGRNYDWNPFSEQVGILWNKLKYRKIQDGHFFLSDTPTVRSRGWDGRYIKLCSWVKLQEIQTAKEFYVISGHFDTYGQIARDNAAKQVCEFVKTLTEPVLFGGDLNTNIAYTGETTYQTLSEVLDDANTKSKTLINNEWGTYNGFTLKVQPSENRCDYIWGKNVEMLKCETIVDHFNDEMPPSDHYPILLTFNLK